ncbi:bifunctional glutamate--cysteine ligase GshA/glutathione synthetase GshB [Ammoniphilus resinae]|uniref:bifunctional glutamate--cysteine ligase GshA/glutathione synthetase GshB n=1 Tax=Ammoniphilus resinae TaxID=861532 RepID=UPI001AE2D219|nr:bifunctional glutamate--cysteine ligase GshA/glutathione synthetase GshB [Ammoniphilus resinae]
MVKVNRDLLQWVVKQNLQEELLRGNFGLEKENIRVDGNGMLALTPHPKAFGNKMENPYIRTDFSESQIEMITPVFQTISETYDFMETLHDIVTLELEEEYLWPSSNPPVLPKDEEIPIALMSDPVEDQYRMQLAEKYGRKRQLMSGIHYNFSFHEGLLKKLYEGLHTDSSYKDFKNQLYLKVARNLLRYRWLLVYLTGASPVFNKTYLEQCVQLSDHFDDESYFFPNMNSLRNSICGYRNQKPIYVSFDSVETYVRDLQSLVQAGELLSAREYYSSVRIKPAKGKDFINSLLQDGIAYLELRMIDLNPLYKVGISKDIMQFIHLFLILMLLLEDEPFGEIEQNLADQNHESLIMDGIQGKWFGAEEHFITLVERALGVLETMEEMLQVITPDHESFTRLLEQAKQIIQHSELNFASIVKAATQQSSYLAYHMDKAKQYAEESKASGYKFLGYEDLELSTQLLLKAALKRGIRFEMLDREENFILLQKGDHTEYVKQATKTSLDSYSTVLIMENKVVTKKVLERQGIRVPQGRVYSDLNTALGDYEMFRDQTIVIKPKSTNFGLGITIFAAGGFSRGDFQKAFEMAFAHDKTVLLEEFISGKEYRFLVMGDEVVGVLHRVPANVVGNGLHTIEQLVADKNKDPLRGKGYKTPLERLQLGEAEEMFLKHQGKDRSYVPGAGETVYLRENSNISTGGDSIDLTDEIPDRYKRIAVKAAKAAGATFCGVDMMINDMEKYASDRNYSIIEINFNPAIHIHCFPFKGTNRKADEKILDLLFGKL